MPRIRRFVPAVACGIAIGITLTACSNPEPSLDQPVGTSSATTDADVTSDYSAIPFGENPGATTGPGARLAFGDAAWVEIEVEDDAGNVTGTNTIGLSVLDIVEGDTAYFDSLDNAADYAGKVPYYVITQQTTPGATGFEAPKPERLWPQFADGSSADLVVKYGVVVADCPLELPAYEPTSGTSVTCMVALGEPGKPVTQVAYDGLGQFDFLTDETDVYAGRPIVWTSA